MSQAITILFKDVFPNYESFKEFTDNIGITTTGVEDSFNQKCYIYLFYKYYNQNINYEVEDNFLRGFALEYMNQYEKFKKEKTLIDAIYGLNLDELIETGEIISNFAGNPNNQPSNPKQALNYVINQNVSYSKGEKFYKYLNALDSLTTMRIDEFLDKFKYLFMFNLNMLIYIYEGEE